MAEELGLTSLIVPETHDGAGFGMVELAIVMEELGRVLLCAPYLSSAVLATSTLALAADEAAQAELLPRLACGELRATLAFSEERAPWELGSVEMTATAAGDGFTLDGEKTFVLDGLTADVILVVARAGGETTLFQVAGDAPGLSGEALPPFDATRKLAKLSFRGTPAQRIASGDASEGIERALTRAVAALAAEQVGGAQRCLDMAVEYAKTSSRSPPPTTRPSPRKRATRLPGSRPPWPSPSAPRPTGASRSVPFRSTAAWGSPGSTPAIST
jgi:alkylation response protein AidB-like acyl-CoA dehydrogenase